MRQSIRNEIFWILFKGIDRKEELDFYTHSLNNAGGIGRSIRPAGWPPSSRVITEASGIYRE